VSDSVFRRKVRRCQIVIAIGDKDFKVRIGRHGFAQRLRHLDVAILMLAKTPLLVGLEIQNFVGRSLSNCNSRRT